MTDRLRANSSFLLLAVLMILSITVLHPFLISLSLGGIFAISLIPLQRKLRDRFHLSRGISTTVLMIGFISLILTPIGFVLYKAIEYMQSQAASEKNLATTLTEIAQRTTELLRSVGFPISMSMMQKQISVFSAKMRQVLGEFAQSVIVNSPDSVLQFTVMLLTMTILLLKHKQILHAIVQFRGISRTCLAKVMDTVSNVCRDVVFANIITGVIQATLVAVAVAFTTEWDPALIFIVTFVTSFIPIVGAAPIAVLIAVIEFYESRYGTGWALIATALIVGISDNIVRAWLMSSNKNDSSFLNLLGTLGGIYIWGLPGLFLGPFIVSLTVQSSPFLLKEFEKVYAPHRGPKKSAHRQQPDLDH